ncbi:MAG TPA: twin-arginine translocase subunit TatC, partial [Candidatus Hypogeohydataceae bacterium YC38]
MPIKEAEKEIEEKRLTLGEHLEELRTRIILCVLAIMVCFVLSWVVKTHILWIAKRPHSLTMERLGLPVTLKVLSYQEGFFAYLKLCLISAIFLAYPVIVYQAWKFIAAGLYKHERRYAKFFIPLSFGGFITGGLFGYFILIPLALKFLIGILGPGIEPVITMSQYITLVFLLTLALGLIFQLPLVMLLLSKVGMFRAEDYIGWRRYAFFGAFVLAAIITPTADPFTQTATALPVVALYEVGILLVKPTKRAFLYAGGFLGVGVLIGIGLYMYYTWPAVGRMEKTSGIVEILPEGARGNQGLQKGTALKTAKNSMASFSLGKDIEVYLNQQSAVVLAGKGRIELLRGEVLVKVKEGQPIEINTPSGLVSTEGGELDIKIQGYTAIVTSIKGTATVLVEGQMKTLKEGRQLELSPG